MNGNQGSIVTNGVSKLNNEVPMGSKITNRSRILLGLANILRSFFLFSNAMAKDGNLYIFVHNMSSEDKESQQNIIIKFIGKKLRYISPDERNLLLILEKIAYVIYGRSKKKKYLKEYKKFQRGLWAESTPGVLIRKGDQEKLIRSILSDLKYNYANNDSLRNNASDTIEDKNNNFKMGSFRGDCGNFNFWILNNLVSSSLNYNRADQPQNIYDLNKILDPTHNMENNSKLKIIYRKRKLNKFDLFRYINRKIKKDKNVATVYPELDNCDFADIYIYTFNEDLIRRGQQIIRTLIHRFMEHIEDYNLSKLSDIWEMNINLNTITEELDSEFFIWDLITFLKMREHAN
ncbi:MAG: hypothetical protein ACTSVC_02875 [Promethearchaeota archaeon]